KRFHLHLILGSDDDKPITWYELNHVLLVGCGVSVHARNVWDPYGWLHYMADAAKVVGQVASVSYRGDLTHDLRSIRHVVAPVVRVPDVASVNRDTTADQQQMGQLIPGDGLVGVTSKADTEGA